VSEIPANPTPGPEAAPDLHWLGDSALMLGFGSRIDPALSLRVLAVSMRLAAARLPGVIDVVPAYASVALVLDPDSDAEPGALESRVRELLSAPVGAIALPRARRVLIPACYGGTHGADLQAIAEHAGLDAAQVIERHAAAEYRVAMIGFKPGFPYLLGLDPALAMPRRATPRASVPAGSVAIGGPQTGIYPVESPGGWQLIGRTSVRLFDPALERPSLLAPGDLVRFRPVAAHELAAARVEIVDA
jgi:KipI family sensor histidine kinase inhibitor